MLLTQDEPSQCGKNQPCRSVNNLCNGTQHCPVPIVVIFKVQNQKLATGAKIYSRGYETYRGVDTDVEDWRLSGRALQRRTRPDPVT